MVLETHDIIFYAKNINTIGLYCTKGQTTYLCLLQAQRVFPCGLDILHILVELFYISGNKKSAEDTSL